MPAGSRGRRHRLLRGAAGPGQRGQAARTWPSAAAAGSRSPAAKVHLGVEADFRPARKAHPALLVDDLARAGRRLRPPASRSASEGGLDGYDQRYVDDPFGNRIELLAAPDRRRRRRRRRSCRGWPAVGPRRYRRGAHRAPMDTLPTDDRTAAPDRPIAAPAPGAWLAIAGAIVVVAVAGLRGRGPIRARRRRPRTHSLGRPNPLRHAGQISAWASRCPTPPLRALRRPRHLLRRPPRPGPGGQLLVGRVRPVPDRDAGARSGCTSSRRAGSTFLGVDTGDERPGRADRGHASPASTTPLALDPTERIVTAVGSGRPRPPPWSSARPGSVT